MDKQQFYSQFSKAIDNLSELSESNKQKWFNICTLVRLKKGHQLITAGINTRKVAFNLDGLFRLYYIDADGNEFTKGFMPKENIVISYSALVENRGSYFNVEALKDSNVLLFDYDKWMQLVENDPEWHKLLFRFVQRAYMMKEKREKAFLLDDATTRYLDFKANYADIEKDLKQYHVASFLGITPVALSRIRKTLKEMV